jgi:hypothetical protein
MQNDPKILEKLPVHPVEQRESGAHVLRVDGLVGRTLELTESDFDGLPQRDVTADFNCEEGWTVPAVRWWGINLDLESEMGSGERGRVYGSDLSTGCQKSAARYPPGRCSAAIRARRPGSIGRAGRRLLDKHQVAGPSGATKRARREHGEDHRAGALRGEVSRTCVGC